MKRYTLTASLAGTGTSRFTFTEDSDMSAMFEAIGVILDRAMDDVIWAKGAIALRNAEGALVQAMEAK